MLQPEISNAKSEISEKMRILLVEDNPGDARLIHEMLMEISSFRFEMVHVEKLAGALEHLKEATFNVILLDLNLPDSQGLDSFIKVHTHAPEAPIVVLSGLDDGMFALRAVQEGAQDYLVKGRVDGDLLIRSFRYAVERQRFLIEVEKKNEEIREITQQLWQATKLATLGELAASIAHELNNPLQTVSLRVESLMLGIPSDHPGRRDLGIIEQEIERMANLVGNLLEFSHRGKVQISTVDLREEVRNTLELIHCHLRKRGIAVVEDYPKDLPAINADRQLLRQLFLNLFTNASDAMPTGGTLKIGICVAGNAVIEIADTGSGIAPQDLPKVLEPFFTTKPEGKGTGLGLPICRRIVQDHGGTFEIASEVGKGTTVRIALPVRNKMNGAVLREGFSG